MSYASPPENHEIRRSLTTVLGLPGDLPGEIPPQFTALIGATMTLFEEADSGECKACRCTNCETIRGLITGIASWMP